MYDISRGCSNNLSARDFLLKSGWTTVNGGSGWRKPNGEFASYKEIDTFLRENGYDGLSALHDGTNNSADIGVKGTLTDASNPNGSSAKTIPATGMAESNMSVFGVGLISAMSVGALIGAINRKRRHAADTDNM